MNKESDELERCKICGATLERVECWNCCNESCVDAYETDPIKSDAGDLYQCVVCGGKGTILECPDAESHPAMVDPGSSREDY
jgi:hypothetical protein